MLSPFRTARPIWPEGRAEEMNRFVGFRVLLPPSKAETTVLYITASSVYRVWANGDLVGHGPARGPHGQFRVDTWTLDSWLGASDILISVEVVGYNVNSYYLLDQPAFLLAEVQADSTVAASTAGAGQHFEATLLDDHVQRVERYSVARTFSEAFRLRPGCHAWRSDPTAAFASVPCGVGSVPPLLPRRVPVPSFQVVEPERIVVSGQTKRGKPPTEPYRDWTLTGLGPDLKGYPEASFEVSPSIDWQAVRTVTHEPEDTPFDRPFGLSTGTFRTLDFGVNRTGFVGLRLRCPVPTRLYVLFDELLTEGRVDPRRLRCLNLLDCQIEPGVYEWETFEPYTLRYFELAVLEGACAVERVWLRRYDNPEADRAVFHCDDERLNRLWEAARETLRQNALDLLTDCPSRERAGWPCDSFFTARAAHLLTGSTAIEHVFLENYVLPEHFANIPDGMLPMNYPADHPNGDFLGERDAQFIPNWPLWLILQLEEYAMRSGDRTLVSAFEPKVRALFDWFEAFINEVGLLEDLEGWVFVEWSKANDFTEGVNVPTNMLWAAALDAAGRLYDDEALCNRANHIRTIIAERAFDGRFFVDQLLREDRALRHTTHRTEVCQYYAFYFGVATPETHGALWETLRCDFGPGRDPEGTHGVHPAAMLNGHFLRLELLERYGYAPQALDEAIAYFLPMAETTGTLWEHDEPTASCCHGFASHLAVTLCRHIFGLDQIVGDTVFMRQAEGKHAGHLILPLGSDVLEIRHDGDSVPTVQAPPGFAVQSG